jgi:hypothetical protein
VNRRALVWTILAAILLAVLAWATCGNDCGGEGPAPDEVEPAEATGSATASRRPRGAAGGVASSRPAPRPRAAPPEPRVAEEPLLEERQYGDPVNSWE